METFRQLILDASTQPTGSSLRAHLNNLNAGGSGGGNTFEVKSIEVQIQSDYMVEVDTTGAVIVLEDE